MPKFLKYLWVLPATCVGLAVVPLAVLTGGKAAVQSGAIEVHGGLLQWVLTRTPMRVAAMTLGHVIVGRTQRCLDDARVHEHVHIRQYELWGIFFIPAYFIASVVALLTGQDPYYGNVFEKEAYEKEKLQ